MFSGEDAPVSLYTKASTWLRKRQKDKGEADLKIYTVTDLKRQINEKQINKKGFLSQNWL